jgi:excisionase family DNA binding protein
MSTVGIGNFVSVKEAAEIIGCTTGRIRQMLGENLLRGRKFNGKAWAIEKQTVKKVAGQERKPGPKPAVSKRKTA